MTSRTKSSLGELVFRWRSYLPLAVLGGLIVGLWISNPQFDHQAAQNLRVWVVAGLLVAAAGLALRFYTVGHAPPGTSGRHRRQHAARLNTFGIYSVVRHPLYVGNLLVWSGVSIASGWWPGALGSILAGALMFALIVRHEDYYLAGRFDSDFEEWRKVTPAFVPRFALWRPARNPFRWARAVASEYSTLHTIGLIALIFAALRGWRELPPWTPSLGWWGLLALNSAVYLGLRLWRTRRRARG